MKKGYAFTFNNELFERKYPILFNRTKYAENWNGSRPDKDLFRLY